MLSIWLDSIESTRIVSPAVDMLFRKSICKGLKKYSRRVYTGWVENVVDSIRFEWIETNRFPWCRFVILVVDLRES